MAMPPKKQYTIAKFISMFPFQIVSKGLSCYPNSLLYDNVPVQYVYEF